MRLPPIQEVIHWLEVGQGARALRITASVLAVVTLCFYYNIFQFKNFESPEAMEAAQLARNLAEGEGYTTKVIRPLSIQMVEDTQGVQARLNRAPHPDLYNPPLYPLLLAGWLRVMPVNYEIDGPFWRYAPEIWIGAFNQVLFLLAVYLCYRLAKRLVSAEAGVVLAVVLLVSDMLWRYSTSGLPMMLALLLVVALAWVTVMLGEGVEERRRRGWFLAWGAAAGLLVGLAALTRYALLVLALPMLWFLLRHLGRRAFLTTLVFLVTMAAVVTPWFVRNYQLCGHPLGVAGTAVHQETTRFPGTTLERTFAPDLTTIENRDYFRKLCISLRNVTNTNFLGLGGTAVTALFLTGLLWQYRHPALLRLRGLVIFSLLALALAQGLARTYQSTYSPTANSEQLLVLLTPLVALLGIAFYFRLLDYINLPFQEFRHFLSTMVVVLSALPLLMSLLPPRPVAVAYPPYYPPHLQETSSFFKTNELLMSDMPWAVAWYGNRRCVWTPMHVLEGTRAKSAESFFKVHDLHQPVSGLLLTPLTTDAQFRRQILQGPQFEWSRFAMDVLLRTNLPSGFPLLHSWVRGKPDYVFLADRARWREVRSSVESSPTAPRPGQSLPIPKPEPLPTPR